VRKDLPRLCKARTKCEHKLAARWTKSRVARNRKKFEPLPISPSRVDHRSPQKAYCKLQPSKTGVPIIGKPTITHVRLLKELYDMYALLYDLVRVGHKHHSFVKRHVIMLMEIFRSKNKDFYQSWYIRRMERLVFIELRSCKECAASKRCRTRISYDYLW